MERLAYTELYTRLVAAVPEFSDQVAQHVAENDEVLGHVVLGDFALFVVESYRRGDDRLAERCLSFVENEMRYGDSGVRNAVQVSFVADVGPWQPEMESFVRSWPPLLRQEAARQVNWKPGDPGPMSVGHRQGVTRDDAARRRFPRGDRD